MGKIWRKEYEGLESLNDCEEDIYWAIRDGDIVPNGKWQGTLVITLEYFEEEE